MPYRPQNMFAVAQGHDGRDANTQYMLDEIDKSIEGIESSVADAVERAVADCMPGCECTQELRHVQEQIVDLDDRFSALDGVTASLESATVQLHSRVQELNALTVKTEALRTEIQRLSNKTDKFAALLHLMPKEND